MGRIGEIFKWKNKAGYLDAQTDSKGILISQIAVLTGGFAIPTAKARRAGPGHPQNSNPGTGSAAGLGLAGLGGAVADQLQARADRDGFLSQRFHPADCRVQGGGGFCGEDRRLGFFSFQLCPVLVLQGVDIRLGEAAADNGWMRELGSRLAPGLAGRGRGMARSGTWPPAGPTARISTPNRRG